MKVEVVLRFSDQDGAIDITDCETVAERGRDPIFGRSEAGGIGERKYRSAFATEVVPLGDQLYRIEDPWYGHPFNCGDGEEAPGGLAFRDVFSAERLPDGSLRFDRLVKRAGWRVDYWMLPASPLLVESPVMSIVVAKIEEHGGFAERDPWVTNWLWTFLPPESDFDPTSDIEAAVRGAH